MSATFNGSTGAKVLRNSAQPVTTTPLTVGVWFNCASNSGTAEVWSLRDVNANEYFSFEIDTSGNLEFWTFSGGVQVVLNGGTVTLDAWTFAVARAVSSTNRHWSVLHPDGSIVHATSVTSLSPTGVSVAEIGSFTTAFYFNGLIAEFWYTDTDIQAAGTQLSESTLRQLAYGGPFSIPHIKSNIVEYHSLRSSLASEPRMEDVYYGKFGRQAWSNTNSVLLGPHPPLPHWYAKPGQNRRVLIV